MKCAFCSKAQEPGMGIILALNDGRVLYFCSSKCKCNYDMKRDPKKIKWARVKQVKKAKKSA